MILDMTAFMTLLFNVTFVTHLLAKISKRKKSQDPCKILLHNSIDEN